jgi:hypothetical protein
MSSGRYWPTFQRSLLPPSQGDDGGSKLLLNVGQYLSDYTAQHLRNQQSSYSWQWEPEISAIFIYAHSLQIKIHDDCDIIITNELWMEDNVCGLLNLLYLHEGTDKLFSRKSGLRPRFEPASSCNINHFTTAFCCICWVLVLCRQLQFRPQT